VVEFKRKKGENFESFLRRFNKSLLKSRKLNEVRGRRFLTPKKNNTKQKDYALMAKKMREEKEYLRKIGKLKDEPKGRW
jgi:ribosomal protein S21